MTLARTLNWGEKNMLVDLARSTTLMEKRKEAEEGEKAEVTDVIVPVAKDTEVNFPVATKTRPTKLWVSLMKIRQPQPMKKMKTPEMTISSTGSVVLELDFMANLCTDGRRLLVILLSPAQQQLIRTYDVTSHYIIGMKCEHGRSCRDPEPSCLVLTVPSRPRDTQDPSHLSNKLPGWHRHRSCGAWRIPRVKEKTWWRRWMTLTRPWMLWSSGTRPRSA